MEPKSFKEFLGQDGVKRVLRTAVEAAKKRGEPLDHVLFYGPPGTGKTTLSKILAAELGTGIKIISAPTVERKGDIVAILSSLSEGEILFIDEIHRLGKPIEETLYTAMEEFKVYVVSPARRKPIVIDVPPFTLIGATTRLNLLSPPFRSRFGIVCKLEPYSERELVEIGKMLANKYSIAITEDALKLFATGSRGTPRILKQLINRLRDYVHVYDWKVVDKERAKFVLSELGIDENGLSPLDRKIIKTIAKTFNGGPVSITTLAMVLKEDIDTIQNIHEPFLIEKGLLVKTSKGRKLTPKGLLVAEGLK